MRIVCLDQNRWINLAEATLSPINYPLVFETFQLLQSKVENGDIIIPLTFANMYETMKIDDKERRQSRASVQANLSRGQVFVGMKRRLRNELRHFFLNIREDGKFTEKRMSGISGIFWECVGDGEIATVPTAMIEASKIDPISKLYHYLAYDMADDLHRRFGIENFSKSMADLRKRVEERRARLRNETLSIRRRVYSAILMLEHIDLILACANENGFVCKNISDIGDVVARRIMNEVPTFVVERELSLKLEAQEKDLTENDFRDMGTYVAAIPYADIIFGENNFINMSKQAGFHKQFGFESSTNIADALQILV